MSQYEVSMKPKTGYKLCAGSGVEATDVGTPARSDFQCSSCHEYVEQGELGGRWTIKRHYIFPSVDHIQDLDDRLANIREHRTYLKVTSNDVRELGKRFGYIYETSDDRTDAPWVLVREKQDYNPVYHTWGDIVATYEVGPYKFIEYIPKKASNVSQEEYDAKGGRDQRLFSPFINGRSIGRSYHSLDSALVGVVAYKYDGPNTRADTYFNRAIGNLHNEEACSWQGEFRNR